MKIKLNKELRKISQAEALAEEYNGEDSARRIKSLTNCQKELIRYYYLKGLGIEETAKRLNLSVPFVSVQVRSIKRKLNLPKLYYDTHGYTNKELNGLQIRRMLQAKREYKKLNE